MAQGGAPTPYPPSVQVTDDRGLPLGNVVVDFAIVLGGGSLVSSQAVSGANGFATAGSWTLGPTSGRNVVRATSPSTRDTVFVELEAGDADTLRSADRFVLDRIDGMLPPLVVPNLSEDANTRESVLLAAVVELRRDRFVFRWTTRASGATNAVEHVVAGTVKASGRYLEFEMDGMNPLEYFRTSPAILLADGRLRIVNFAEGWPLFGNFQDFTRAPLLNLRPCTKHGESRTPSRTSSANRDALPTVADRRDSTRQSGAPYRRSVGDTRTGAANPEHRDRALQRPRARAGDP